MFSMFDKVISNDRIFAEALSLILKNQEKMMIHFGLAEEWDSEIFWIGEMRKDLGKVE